MMTAEQEMQRIRQNKRPYTPYGAARVLWGNRSSEILIEGPAGTGKAQPLSSTVMCPSGPRKMRDIAPGDLVCCPDGTARKVKAIFPQGVKDVYELTFSCGEKVRCTVDHLWKVGVKQENGEVEWEERTTSNLIARMSRDRRSGSLFRVPLTQPVEFQFRKVTIDPYVLGVLIGDGCLSSGPEFTSADVEIVERVQARVGDGYSVSKHPSSPIAYRICQPTRKLARRGKKGYVSQTISGKWMSRVRVPGGKQKYIGSFDTHKDARTAIRAHAEEIYHPSEIEPTLIDHLKRYKLLGKRSFEKSIPDDYMFNTSAVRWEIVRGLMDTDGTVDRTRGAPTFCTTSHRLARQFRWLIESLGGMCVIRRKKTQCRDAFNCFIRIERPERLFSLPRKRNLCFRKKPVARFIRSIKKVRREECQCIKVDSSDGLYLTDRFVVTHNTRAVLEKIFFMLMKYPGSRGLIVRKTREAMTTSVLVTLEEKVIPAGSPILEGPQRKLRTSYVFPNGSELDVGGMDKSSKVMSTEYDVIGVFEATELTEEDYENLTSRLRNYVIPYQQIIADCNPGPPSHWLNRRANDPKKGIVRLKSYHRDNPVFFDMKLGDFNEQGKTYLKKLSNLTGVRRLRLLEGLWRAAEGAVYGDWRNDLHMVDELPAGWEQWRKVRSIDFGFNNPFVCLWGAVDPDGDIYIYRQMYMTQRTVNQHAKGVWNEDGDKRILLHEGIIHYSEGEEIEATVADHDREDRATLEEAGINTLPAYKEIEVGIEAVKERLRPQLRGSGKILPRIFILRGCLAETDTTLEADNKIYSTEQEFDAYVYEKAKEGKAAKEIPVDKDNHGLDALRYLVAYVDNLAGDQISVVAEEPAVVS